MRERALLDTNVLTALRDGENVRHEAVVREVDRLRRTHDLLVAPQSLYEFWTVATRPREVNGLGWTLEDVALEIELFRQIFRVLPDPPSLLDKWIDLCRTHGVLGKNAHDARLAAYGRMIGVEALVTLNSRDFARYGLNVVVP